MSGKISENDGLLSKRWRKCSWGGEQTRCHHRDGLLQNHYSELLEDFQRPYNSKNMVFNVKKLLNVGVDFTLQQRAKRSNLGRMSGTFCRFRLLLARFCW